MILVIVALATILASVWDFHTKEIPDQINYFIGFCGLFYWGYVSFAIRDPIPFALSMVGAAIFFIIAFGFTKYDLWGGGDSKLLIGYGACIAPYGFMFSVWFFVFLFAIGIVTGLGGRLYFKSIGYTWQQAAEEGLPFAHAFLIALLLAWV